MKKSRPVGGKRRFLRWGGGALLLAGVCGLSFGIERGRRWLTTEGRFPITEARVIGCEHLFDGEVFEFAKIRRGANIFSIDTGLVEERLEESGWIIEARVRRRPPGKVILEVKERRPWMLIPGAEPMFIDREGTLFPSLGKEERLDLPILTDRSERAAGVVAHLAAAFPPDGDWLSGRVSQVSIDREGGVTLTELGSGTTILFGTEEFEERARRLLSVIETWERRGERYREIDLRYGRQAFARERVVRPGEGRS